MGDKPKMYTPGPHDTILPIRQGPHKTICLILTAAPGEYEAAEYLMVLYYYETERHDRGLPHVMHSGSALPLPEVRSNSSRYAQELWQYLISGIGFGLQPHVLQQAKRRALEMSFEEMGEYLDRKLKETMERERSTANTSTGSGPVAGED